jgi:periplasmic mercuric ion binding protein
MKTLQIFSLIAMMSCLTTASFAQTSKKESFKVAGECSMCKKKIEKAAKDAGATYALWNTNSKLLIVKYNSTSTNSAKIQQKIAGVGYDTPKYKATDEAYNNLDDCCQYERSGVKADCCDSENCKDAGCCKDGKCTKENSDCCKKQ